MAKQLNGKEWSFEQMMLSLLDIDMQKNEDGALDHTMLKKLELKIGVELQDGGRVRYGDHLPPHRYIRNTSTCGIPPIEHILNAGRRPQTSQKARNSPTYLGRAKEKRKNRDKK